MRPAGWRERIGPSIRCEQHILEARPGRLSQAMPLINWHQNCCLNSSLRNDLRTLGHACGKELAKVRLGFLNRPYFAHEWIPGRASEKEA